MAYFEEYEKIKNKPVEFRIFDWLNGGVGLNEGYDHHELLESALVRIEELKGRVDQNNQGEE